MVILGYLAAYLLYIVVQSIILGKLADKSIRKEAVVVSFVMGPVFLAIVIGFFCLILVFNIVGIKE